MKRFTIIFLFFTIVTLRSQTTETVRISGIVKDQAKQPVVGASVYLKDSKLFSLTDSLGKFTITVPKDERRTIYINYVGYTKQAHELTGQENLTLEFILELDNNLNEIQVVSARRREEIVQSIPIPLTVLGGNKVNDAGAFNVNRVKEFVPSVQLYSSNPRNTTLNIRGLGSTFGLTNDGIDPGVGFYIDGVYYARPAVTTLDFIDIERIEVLRGPQGTLFGKNTTAGTFNITTKQPSFNTEGSTELSYGNFQFLQAKASVSTGLTKKIATRISLSGTYRDGLLENVKTNSKTNTLNNQGVRVQLYYTPNSKLGVNISANYNIQRPDGYAQVVAGVVNTQRPAYRQFESIAKDLNYSLPSTNAFERKIDHDVPWKSFQDLGSVALNLDYKIGKGTLTSTSAWAFWNWNPSNDRDFTGLQALSLSQNPSKQTQLSQEIRYAGQINERLSGVVGLYAIDQLVTITGTEESGKDQWRFSQSTTSNLWKTPGLLDGYGIKTNAKIESFSAAAFGQLDWNVFKGFHILPGIRYNFDEKIANYERITYGGLITNDQQLLSIKRSVFRDQYYHKGTGNTNFSGNATLSYQFSNRLNLFATYSKGFKPVGVNVAGLPTLANGDADLDLAIIKPEEVSHYEFGIKSTPIKRSTLNLTAFNTDILNYQTNVQSPELGVNRGYLANADKVNVKGIELEGSLAVKRFLNLFFSGSYTDGKYVKFENAPLPLEETGKVEDGKQVAFKDISGQILPGISKWAGSIGTEFSVEGKLLGNDGRFYLSTESSYRSDFSSSPTPSKYLNINAYNLVNARIGFRASKGISIIIWGRNILNENYFEQLLPAGGNAGHYGAVLGDPRTIGVTLKYNF